ncbi:hypothetical protein [Natrononativus amylolyticus]|uniref:hypothetical protein n=1 Tax=Natrononativus amylolyticus TaxID=2963434 RepID=UPI0020CE64A8|nr:hypothetical protein [Natrononativus amylolyticus]
MTQTRRRTLKLAGAAGALIATGGAAIPAFADDHSNFVVTTDRASDGDDADAAEHD